jgi:hypothetical protein
MKAGVCSSRSFAHRYAVVIRNAFMRVGIKKTRTSKSGHHSRAQKRFSQLM